jgi:hypothetical protein
VEQKMLRVALDHAAEWIFQCLNKGKEPMICSEAVYRCFAEAPPPGPLPVIIAGVIFPRLQALQAGRLSLGASIPELDATRDRLLSAWRGMMDARARRGSSPGWDPVVAACVTPHDLQASPNLRLLGTLGSLRK